MRQFTKFSWLIVAILFAVAGCTSGYSSKEGVASHAYGIVEVSKDMPLPAIEMEINPDAVAGWNLHLMTENIEFAPEYASTEHYPGQGHAHLYVNGKMMARLYSKWYHIPKLPYGNSQITVTLNSNDHNAYAVNGEIISDSTIIKVERPASESSSSSSSSSSSGSGY